MKLDPVSSFFTEFSVLSIYIYIYTHIHVYNFWFVVTTMVLDDKNLVFLKSCFMTGVGFEPLPIKNTT